MKNVLITGATGNIGSETIDYLSKIAAGYQITAAVRSVETGKNKLNYIPNVQFRVFDFKDANTFRKAFEGVDILFLLRPPQISKVNTYFRPLLRTAKESGIKNIIFLSVQGAEKNKVIPHHKIENLVKEFNFNYIFVRPSYFMQNLTTTFLLEIRDEHRITLPSGDATFNWIDVKNIGEVIAHLIVKFNNYKNQAIEVTGYENLSFPEVTEIITEVIGKKVLFKNVNPISFYVKKRREGFTNGYTIVLTLLHFLPRFQKAPKISRTYKSITGNNPFTVKEFILREKGKFI